MTRGHGWSLTFTMWGTFTPYFLPAFTGAFYGFIYMGDLKNTPTLSYIRVGIAIGTEPERNSENRSYR